MRPTLLMALLLCLCACSRPQSVEYFVPSGDAVGGVFEFPLDFSDPAATYSLSFYARRDISARNPLSRRCSRLIADWIDPCDSLQLSDTVYMNLGTFRGVVSPYREDVKTERRGQWHLKVRIDSAGRGFRGLGLVCRRNGTR